MADCCGIALVVAGSFWMSQLNLYISPGQVVWPRAGLIVGLSMVFAPVNVAAFMYTPPFCAGRRWVF